MARTYGNGIPAGDTHKWWANSSESPFTWASSINWKFIVIKCPIPAAPTNDLVVALSIKESSNPLEEIPVVTASHLSTPTVSAMKPVVWMQEVGNTNTHPDTKLPATFSGLGKTGWMATHLDYNPGAGQNDKCNNNSGCYERGIAGRVGKKTFKTFGVASSSAGAFDIYFRIGLANGTSYDIEQLQVQFKNWNNSTGVLTDITGTNGLQTFTYKQ